MCYSTREEPHTYLHAATYPTPIRAQPCRVASGAFVRNLGWKRTALGYAQHKFHLGKDEQKAELANRRLEQLWDEVSKRWERENDSEVYPTDRPVWDEVGMAIAEAVRKGEPAAKVPVPRTCPRS